MNVSLSLRAKLMLLIVLAFLPVVALEVNTTLERQEHAAEDVKAGAIRLAEEVASSQQTTIESSRQLLMTLAQVDSIRRRVGTCEPLLERLLKQNPLYANLGACDLAGNVFCSALKRSGAVNLADRPYFQRAVQTRDFAVGEFEVGRITGKPTLDAAYPLLDDEDRVIGVVFVALDLRAISQAGARLMLPPGGTMSMTSDQNVFLLHYPDPWRWIGKPFFTGKPVNQFAYGAGEGTFEARGVDGVKRLYAVQRLVVSGQVALYVHVGVAEQPAFSAFYHRLLLQVGAVTGIGAVALAGAWVLGSFFIVQPARHLVGVARAVSAGDLAVRSSVSADAGEFGEIGFAFNQMADALGRRIEELNQVQLALRQAHDQLESQVERRTAALRLARERLVDAIENIDAGFAMFDSDEFLVIYNQPFRETFGLCGDMVKQGVSYEELLREFVLRGATVAGVPPEQWVEERLAAFREADGRNVEQNINGRWIRIRDRRTRDGGVVLLRTDVTSLKEIQETLLLRNRAIAALNTGLIVTDPTLPNNPVVDANAAFERITGYSKEEIVGHNCRLLQGADTDPEAIEVMRRAIREACDCQVTVKNYRKDGSLFWNEIKIAPVLDASGRLTHFVGVLTDVTERVRAQEALELAAEELRRSNQELEQFAYVASHDLQEPLRMVASYTQLLARRYKDQLDQNAQDFIGFAVDGAQRMQGFIHDLLLYSRVGTHGRPFERLAVGQVLQRALDNLRFAIEEKHAEVVVGEMPEIEADPIQLAQLFQNLIGNALKFSADRPLRIKIDACRRDGEWEFAVEDNGIGIDPKDCERIFVIFQRLHSRQEYEGTGLGLAISKKIVERHRGRIWVKSQRGEGTTFFFTLRERQA